MFENTLSDYHVQYLDVVKHWHAPSERYTGGDALLTALYNGWEMVGEIIRENFWYAGMRCVTVYTITLSRNGDNQSMRVIHNPYVSRLVNQSRLPVVSEA